MSFQFLTLYTGDYLRDTRHLTPLKHGIYLLLLMHYWDQSGPLPLDEQECAGISNCRSADEIDAMRYILSRYFVKMDDGWYNKRMEREILRAKGIHDEAVARGKRSAESRRVKYGSAHPESYRGKPFESLSKASGNPLEHTTTTTTVGGSCDSF